MREELIYIEKNEEEILQNEESLLEIALNLIRENNALYRSIVVVPDIRKGELRIYGVDDE